MDEEGVPVIAGFNLIEKIGAGGTATVFKAEDSDGTVVAVKILHPFLAQLPDVRRVLEKEAAVLSTVSGPGVATLRTVHTDQDSTFLVMDFVDGKTLQELASASPMRGVLLTSVVKGTLRALSTIHQSGVIHRDLKPSNVMLGPDGVTVLDFGLSVVEELAGVTRPRDGGGTPGWMSPEQIVGNKVDEATDIFNLGMLIGFLATGANVFGEGRPEALLYRIAHESPDLSNVPSKIRALVAKCLEKDPADRPSLQEVEKLFVSATADTNDDDSIDDDATSLASATVFDRISDDRHDAFGASTRRPSLSKRAVAIVASITLVLLAGVAVVLDQFVVDYSGDIEFRYINASQSNPPQSGGAITVILDGAAPKTIRLPSRNTPRIQSENVGRWSLGSLIELSYQPPFSEDQAVSLRTSAAQLGISRIHLGQTLVFLASVEDERVVLSVGFADGPTEIKSVLSSRDGTRGNEARYINAEEQRDRDFRDEQRDLYLRCVSSIQDGWSEELSAVLGLQEQYPSIRDGYFTGDTKSREEWANLAYAISDAMFQQNIDTWHPNFFESVHYPFTPDIYGASSDVFTNHNELSLWWEELGNDIWADRFNPVGGSMREFHARQFLFIDLYEQGLIDAAESLRNVIRDNPKDICRERYPDS
jgi:serine/threonine protein kinase